MVVVVMVRLTLLLCESSPVAEVIRMLVMVVEPLYQVWRFLSHLLMKISCCLWLT